MSVCTQAADLYSIRPLSERELMQTYTSMMLDACRHSDKDWHTLPSDPKQGYWGDGVSEGNQGIRSIAEVTLTCGALLRYSDVPKGDERREMVGKANAAIRYVISTHVTGTEKCADHKQWGNSWQSGMWTGELAFGGWLMWDWLEPDVRSGVERVVASEADRLLAIKPPTNRWGDTKAEENGWDLTCISVAANMLPSHPHAAAWREQAIEYMMNTLSVPRDMNDKSVVDGKPVSEWVHGANLNPDFTLENHSIFHPSYVQCSSYFLTEAAMHYKYAGRPIPQAATHHLMDTWRMFETILLPSGETTYPQSQDWELHGLNPINLFASLGTYMKDPNAARMENINIQYMRAWQEWCDGSLAVPGSPLGFTRHAIQGAQAAFGFLAHKIFGPAVDVQMPPQHCEDYVRRYASVDVVLHRTASKLVTFSWKNRIMGVLTPTGGGHEGNPFFTIPITNGFVGSVELGKSGKAEVRERAWKKTDSGFETSGVLLTNGGLLKQAIRMTSVGEKTVVYQDRITAESDVAVTRELGVPIGIENDSVSGGKRVLHYGGGQITLDWQKPLPVQAVSGTWANVDGRLGMVAVAGSGLAYEQATKYNGQGVYADVLYASFSDALRSFKAGEEVARRVVVLAVEITPEETAALCGSARVDGKVLRFALPEGGDAEVALL